MEFKDRAKCRALGLGPKDYLIKVLFTFLTR